MLEPDLKAQLQQVLTNLRAPIELIAHLDNGESSAEMRGLLEDVAAAGGGKVSVRDAGSNADVRVPSFGIAKEGDAPRVSFAGLPLGHEFTSLILALLHVGGHPPRLPDEVLEQFRTLDGEYVFETYFSQSCQNCPDVVQALNTLAALNPNVRHVAIDGALFGEEVERRGILTVPQVFLNGEPFAQGRMSAQELISKLDSGAAARSAEKLKDIAPFDVLIVGGGPAGAAAAIYAARKGIRTGIVAERFGGQVQDTMAIENFPSVEHTEGPIMGNALEAHVRSYGVEVIANQRAAKLDGVGADGLASVTLESGPVLRAKTVILAPGARWRQTGVPGEDAHRNKGVTFCPHCDGPLFKGKRVAVIGGGNSGIEAAIDLAGIVEHVTVLEFGDALRADAVLQKKLASMPNTDVHLNAQTTEMVGDGTRLAGLNFNDRTSGEARNLDVAGVFVQIGLLPNTEWLKGAVELSERGEIIIDARGATNVPGVFAAGDATTVPYKQIVIAMGAGSTAALSAFDHLIRQEQH